MNWTSKIWVLILLVFLALGWTYSQDTPLLETPDESSHFEIAAYIAAQRRLPPMPQQFRTGVAPAVSTDLPYYYAPPLYYILSAFLVGNTDTQDFATAVILNPNFTRNRHISLGLDLSNKNMYVHTADQRPPYAAWAVAFRRVRLFSLLLGAVTVVGSIQLTALLWPAAAKWRWRWVAICLAAFNATFLYVSGGVSNDSLLIAISTWSLVLMTHMLMVSPAKNRTTAVFSWREGVLALLLGAGALTKQSAFILWPLAGLTLLLMAWKQQRVQWRWVKTGLSVAAIATIVGGWWYLQNWLRYGDPLALSAHPPLIPAENVSDQLFFLLAQSWGSFQSFWAAFGWATIFVHPVWYVFFAVLTIGGVSGWFLPESKRSVVSWSLEISVLLWSAVFLNGIAMTVWLWRTPAAYGRLLFPVIVPLACLIVEGWRFWFLRTPVRLLWIVRLWQAVVPTVVITLAMITPMRYLRPAFPPLTATPDQLAEAVPVQVRFGDAFKLVGYSFTPEQPKPGQTVQLTLFWQSVLPFDVTDDLNVFVQLAPQDVEKWVASVDTFLGTSRYPSSVWSTDEIIAQHFSLSVPTEARVPALYWFNVGIYNDQTDARLPVTLGESPLSEEMVRLGPLAVTPEARSMPRPFYATQYDFNDSINLQGYDLIVAPGETEVQIAFYWQALAAPVTDWTVFIHLLDKNGQIVAQHDAQPENGSYPTSWWQPGDWMVDTHMLTIPEHIQLSDLVLKVGLYDAVTLQRAIVVDSQQQQLPENAVLIEMP